VDLFLGSYEGSFATALSPQPEDDLNFEACAAKAQGCEEPYNPLVDIVLRLSRDARGNLAAGFYRNTDSSTPLDLLGRGCGTRVGALENLSRNTTQVDQRYTARFTLHVDNRLCAGRLRPTSSHFILLDLYESREHDRRIEARIDKAVVDKNYLYVKEDGVERRVRIDLNNMPDIARRGRYRVCIEDDEGEFTRCVMTDKELKQIFLPVPLPGGVGANYTWWHSLTPNLKRTRGLYELEQFFGRFDFIPGS
jgi:hypothetical protein